MPLEGVAELDRLLALLPQAVQPKVLRKAVRAGIRPAEKRAKATVPVGTVAHRTRKGRLVPPGFAKRSIRVVTKADRTGQKVSAALGVRRDAFYAVQFVERGTSRHPARPWLRRAFDETVEAQQKALADKLRAEILKFARGARR
jgi:HK97 gp10 family phage protein